MARAYLEAGIGAANQAAHVAAELSRDVQGRRRISMIQFVSHA